jgi:hypothetical protein
MYYIYLIQRISNTRERTRTGFSTTASSTCFTSMLIKLWKSATTKFSILRRGGCSNVWWRIACFVRIRSAATSSSTQWRATLFALISSTWMWCFKTRGGSCTAISSSTNFCSSSTTQICLRRRCYFIIQNWTSMRRLLSAWSRRWSEAARAS